MHIAHIDIADILAPFSNKQLKRMYGIHIDLPSSKFTKNEQIALLLLPSTNVYTTGVLRGINLSPGWCVCDTSDTFPDKSETDGGSHQTDTLPLPGVMSRKMSDGQDSMVGGVVSTKCNQM